MARRSRQTPVSSRAEKIAANATENVMLEWWRHSWPGWLIVAMVLLVYLPVWRAGFIWDDDGHVTKPALRSLAGLGLIWTEPGATQQYYPLLHSAFWIMHRLVGDAALGYHVVTLLFHAANALLLAAILRRLTIPGAWLAAAIFALHPVMVESVAWVSELKNTLSAFFYFLTWQTYLRFSAERRTSLYAAALICFAAALLTKTVTATFPAAFLVVLWWRDGQISWRRELPALVPFFVLGALSGFLTAFIERKLIGAEGEVFNLSFIERGLVAGRVVWFYGGKLIWPAGLMFSYPRWQISASDVAQLVWPVAAIVVVVALWWLRTRWRAPLAGALFFVGTLFPVLGFFNVYPFQFSFVADHFQYLAALGVIVPVAAGLELLSRKYSAVRLGAVTLVASLAVLSWQQCRPYARARDLYEATLERNPSSWLMHLELGNELLRAGEANTAVAHYETAIKLKQDLPAAHYDLGAAFLQQGRLDDAIEQFEEAVRLKPRYTSARHNLGVALAERGRYEEAAVHLAIAVRLDPDFAAAHRNLGQVLLELRRDREAARELQRALQINPDDARARRLLDTLPPAAP